MPARTLLVLALLLFPASTFAQQVVILVRHADRDPNAPDALTEAGHARATALAEVLKDADVSLVVRSDTQRTKDTAAPLARAARLTEKVVTAEDGHVDQAYAAIRAAGPRAVVLYVGHSNTIGPLLQKFGHPQDIVLGPKDYDNLFILMPKDAAPTLLRLRYGAK